MTGNARGCDTALQLEREQNGFDNTRENGFSSGKQVEMLPWYSQIRILGLWMEGMHKSSKRVPAALFR